MSPLEIVHRLGEAGVRRAWRRRAPGLDSGIGLGPVGWSPLLRARLADAARSPAVRRSAEATAAGCLAFLGRDWPRVDWRRGAGDAVWLHDPVTGQRWPGRETHAFAIDVRGTGCEPSGPQRGDAKYVWEPARLQCLHGLAAMAAADDADAARTALAIVRDFAAANPPHAGVHWTSGIEAALRLASLTLLCAGLGRERFDPDAVVLVRRLVAAHARQLAAFPSLYSSANNHRFAEGFGLFLAGRLLPDLGGEWERRGRAILEDLARTLILPDGGGAEQSVVYLAFVLEMGALAALLAEGDGCPLDAAFTQALAAGAGYLRDLLDADGHAPAIGDDDETRVIGQPPDREPRYAASVVAAVAGLTRRPDLLPPARDPHLRDAVFAVPDGSVPPAPGARSFPQAGTTVVHMTLGSLPADLVFDHGPLGHLALAAHGHADALSVWLSLAGEPVLIDAGTWLYHSGGARRLSLRESPSHNGLVVGGASHSTASAAFSWSSKARASRLAFSDGPDWSVTGRHDGYRRRFGVEHRRRVARHGEAIAVGDALVGSGLPLPVEILFLLPGHLTLDHGAGHVSVAGPNGVLCRLDAPEGFTVTIRRGAGEGAVRSPAFGTIEDAQRIVFAGLLGEHEALTLIRPASADPRPGQTALAQPLKRHAGGGA